jgi:hypothetical protein
MTLPQDSETQLPPSAAPLGAAKEPATPSGQEARADSAERMRRCRARRKNRLQCVTIELRETEIDALVRRGRLSADDRANVTALRKALYGFLDQYLE